MVQHAQNKWPAYTAPIEPGVQPICDVLNQIPHVETLWSCHGHPERRSRPFVIFAAPVATSFRLHRLLVQGAAQNILQFNWWMVANFNDEGDLQYTIEPNDYRIPGRRWPWRQWNRKSIDKDLARLAELLASALTSS